MGQRFRLPANGDINDVATNGVGDIFDQPTHQLFALGEGRSGSMPDDRQILGQGANVVALGSREREGGLFGDQRIFSLQFFDLGQFFVPLPFQTSSHQTIVWVDCLVASPGQIRLILCSLDLTVPLALDLPGAGFQRIERGESYLQMGGLDGLQERLHHGLIDTVSSHGLAGFPGQLRMDLVTFVHQQGAVARISNGHPSATGSTQDDSLQKRWPLTDRATVLFGTPGAVIVELALIVQKLFPGNVASMRIQQHNRPVFLFDPACSPFDTWFFPRKCTSPELGAPVDVGSSIQRAMQDVQDPLMGETAPDQFIGLLASPPARGKTQVMLGKVTDHGKGRAELLKEREHQTNRFPNGFIRVEHDLTHGIVDQTNGQAKAQLALLRFRQLSSLQTLMQPMEFGLGHVAASTRAINGHYALRDHRRLLHR